MTRVTWAASILCVAVALGVAGPRPARAHGFSAGDVRIQHPYATPTVKGATTGAAYVGTLENGGRQPDRLVRVASPIAERVEIHTTSVDEAGVMRMREVGEILLAPRQVVRMRPGQGAHFMLLGLKQPLAIGDRFPMTLEFERGGKVEVKVWVQQPKPGAGGPTEHGH